MKRINLPDEEILKLYKAGIGGVEIAERYNCCVVTIYDRLTKMGLPKRYRRNIGRSKLKIPAHDDIVYFAGILDGEGSIPHIINPRSKDGKSTDVSIANCSIPLMEWLVDKFGYKYHEKRSLNSKHLHRQQQWQWRVRRVKDIYRLLKISLPYLIIKKERAQEVITYLEKSYGFNSEVYNESYISPKPCPRKHKNNHFVETEQTLKIIDDDKGE